jgi:hypothetical protein
MIISTTRLATTGEGRKLALLLVLKFAHAIGAAAGVFAVLKIALGS